MAGASRRAASEWLLKSLNPELKLDSGAVQLLLKYGVLHSLPHEVNDRVWWFFDDRISKLTGVREPEEGESPEKGAITPAVKYILENGDTSLRATLTKAERGKIRKLTDGVSQSKYGNPAHLYPTVLREDLEILAGNLSVILERTHNSASLPPSQKDYLEGLIEEAGRCRCRIVSRSDLSAIGTESGNSHEALSARLQDDIWGLTFDSKAGFHYLVWATLENSPLLYPHLTPRGRAVYWMLRPDTQPYSGAHELGKTVSESYGLPSPDSYEFLVWEYYARFVQDREHYWLEHEVWSQKDVLESLGINPIKPGYEYFEYLPRKYHYRYRPRLISSGVDTARLRILEARFLAATSGDFASKSDKVRDHIVFVLAKILKNEKSVLAEELLKTCRMLLRRVLSGPDDRCSREHAIALLKSALRDDLLLYILFYDWVYRAKIVVNDYSDEPTSRGRKRLPLKYATQSILVDLIDLMKEADVRHPYDRAAKIINLIADDTIYSTFPSQGYDTRTCGGAVVRQEYIRLNRESVSPK